MTEAAFVDRNVHHHPLDISDRNRAIAKHHWTLGDDATLRDVVVVVRADEAEHADDIRMVG